MKTFLLFLFSVVSSALMAINPILPTTAFIPDGEPHVFEYKGEKRVYIYGSRDEMVTAFCGLGHDVWSAPVDNLTQWTNHGEVFNVKQIQDLGFGLTNGQQLYAPDCAYNPITKKYYMYVFLGQKYKMDGKEGPLAGTKNYMPNFENFGPRCFVIESESPAGPFVNPIPCDWPAGNEAGTFDPSVLVDQQDDGSIRVYAYWGMRKMDRWAEIDPKDMHTIINPQTKQPDRNAFHKTLPEESETFKSTLFEASSIKKIAKNKYAFIYSAIERNSVLTYCYSNSPEGPWSYGGRIIDAQINWQGGNNHGSIFSINNDWYVNYHRHTSPRFSRQAMIEPINLSYDGDKLVIPTVEMTSQGVEKNGLDAFKRYNANVMCYKTKNVFVDGKQRNTDGLDPVVNVDGKTVIGYKYLNFGNKSISDKDNLVFKLNIKKLENVEISIQLAVPTSTDDKINPVEITKFKLQDYITTNDTLYHEISIPIKNISANKLLNEIGGIAGKKALYLAFTGDGKDLCQLKEIEFSKRNSKTPNPLNEIKISTENTINGKVTALPSRARMGESVKITVEPKAGYTLESINVKGKCGKKIKIQKNCTSQYALENYNFPMPNDEVIIETKFKK